MTVVASGAPREASAAKLKENDRKSDLEVKRNGVGLHHAGESPAHQAEHSGYRSERSKNQAVRHWRESEGLVYLQLPGDSNIPSLNKPLSRRESFAPQRACANPRHTFSSDN